MGLKNFFKGIKEAWDEEQAIMQEEDRANEALMKTIDTKQMEDIFFYYELHRIKQNPSNQQIADYIKYRDDIINNIDKSRSKGAVFFNRMLLTEDFILNIGFPNILVKTDDVWGIVIADPVRAVLKDAIFDVSFLTTNPVIPIFKMEFIVNVDNDVNQQFSNFCNVMLSCCKNLHYKRIVPYNDIVKMIQKDKTFASVQEQTKYAKQAYDSYLIVDKGDVNLDHSEERKELAEWLKSLKYDARVYHQERKTTDHDRSVHFAKKAFNLLDLTATAIGVASGGVSLDSAMRDWDLRHM